ncbi:hypothetical protein SLA2020_435680 [Shorea laevis]
MGKNKDIKFDQEEDREQSTDEVSGGQKSSPAPESSAAQDYVVFAGGGGEGRSGIPNAVVLSRFDFASNALSDQPVAKLGTGSDLPYRMAVHPGGDGLVCSFPKSCRWFEWDGEKSEEAHKLAISVGINNEGSALAAGGEDGNLRVFMWPSMKIVLNEASAHTTVKDLDFSPDGKYLVSLGNRGPARVWDMTSATAVASLPKENVLYIAAVTGLGGSIVTWNTTTWKRTEIKPVVRDTISAFTFSPDGKLLACLGKLTFLVECFVGSEKRELIFSTLDESRRHLILNSTSMRVQTIVRKSHLGFVTALAFSHDSRGLASVSMDSVQGGLSLWVIVLIILLAIAVYFMKMKESLG